MTTEATCVDCTSSVRHTFRDHTTMELVGRALRRMHSFKKDRDYTARAWEDEHAPPSGSSPTGRGKPL